MIFQKFKAKLIMDKIIKVKFKFKNNLFVKLVKFKNFNENKFK